MARNAKKNRNKSKVDGEKVNSTIDILSDGQEIRLQLRQPRQRIVAAVRHGFEGEMAPGVEELPEQHGISLEAVRIGEVLRRAVSAP